MAFWAPEVHSHVRLPPCALVFLFHVVECNSVLGKAGFPWRDSQESVGES